jgi:phosphonate transport system permease protein
VHARQLTAALDIRRDPALRGASSPSAALVVLWPTLVIRCQPWILLDEQSLSATALPGRLPGARAQRRIPRHAAARAWNTVAIATAGLTLALLGAIPATLIINEQLSISMLGTGRMRLVARAVRQGVRWLRVLRSVPELVGLLFVRIIGLGPTAGVLAIALTYCGMLGKVYAEILESSNAHASDTLLASGAGRLQALLRHAAGSGVGTHVLHRLPLGVRDPRLGGDGLCRRGRLGQRMDESMKMLAGAEVAAMLLVFVALVALADQFSSAAPEAGMEHPPCPNRRAATGPSSC